MFTKHMQSWIVLDVKVAKKNQELKAIRDERTRLTPCLLGYMQAHNIQGCNINNETMGTVTYATETTYPSYTQKFVSDALLEFFGGDIEKQAKCVDFLKGKRRPVSHVTLRRRLTKEKQ